MILYYFQLKTNKNVCANHVGYIQMDSKLLTQKSPSVVGLKITQATSI